MNPAKPRACATCGDTFYRQGGVGTKYCPPCCERRLYGGPWEELADDRARKRRLLREYGHICWHCRTTTWNGLPVPLELDHISGNSEDNRRENLRLLCCNCHAQTETYKGKNKASHRRKQFYAKYPRPQRGKPHETELSRLF